MEAQRLARAFGEDALENQSMEVDIEVEPAAEPLDDGDAAGLAVAQTAPPGAPALEGEQGARRVTGPGSPARTGRQAQ